MIKYTFYVLNYFDQRAIEDVREQFEESQLNLFTVAVRGVQFGLLYGLYYLTAKFIQFIISLLMKIPIEDVTMGYIVVPILFFTEVGLSKLNSTNPLNFLLYLSRAFLKFGIIHLLDRVLMSFF